MKPSLIAPAILVSIVCTSALAQEPEIEVVEPPPAGEPEAAPEAPSEGSPEVAPAPEPMDEEAPDEPPAEEVPAEEAEAVEEAEAAVKDKITCRHICQGDFAVGLGIGYTYFAVQGIDEDYISVSDKGDQTGTGILHPDNEDPGNRGSGYGITFTGHFGYTVADNWMIGAAVHYAYQFKTLQLEAFGRYYIKMKQPDTLPFIGLRLGYLWGMGSHNEPVFLDNKFKTLENQTGEDLGKVDEKQNQTLVNKDGAETEFDSQKNSNGFLGAVELGVVHFFTPNVGLFITLGYQYIFTGYYKGGGVDIKGGVAFSF